MYEYLYGWQVGYGYSCVLIYMKIRCIPHTLAHISNHRLTSKAVIVLAPTMPDCICMDETGYKPVISAKEDAANSLDPFNKPHLRRAIILRALEAFAEQISYQTPPTTQALCERG